MEKINLSFEINKKELNDIINNDIPNIVERRKNFFEITRFPHLENVVSNILSFYFDSNEDHNFSDLFVISLLEILKEKAGIIINLLDWVVEREVTTQNGNRIDILIKDISEKENSTTIIIENKIYAGINNPLKDYLNSDKEINKRIGVLLTLFPIKCDLFVNITHKEFIEKVLKNIHSYLLDADDRHILFLKDYYQNILSLTNIREMEDFVKFYLKNGKKLDELFNVRKNLFDHFCEVIKNTDFQLTGITSFSGNREEIWQYIDNSKNSWIKFINKNVFSKNTFIIEVGFYQKIVNFDEIRINTLITDLIKNNSIKEYQYRDVANYPWLYKEYNVDENFLLNYGKKLLEFYNNDWNEINQLIIQTIKIKH